MADITYATKAAGSTFSHEDANEIKTCVNSKIDKDETKVLSDNNYTDAEKTKLSGIEANANNYSLPTATDTVKGGIKVGSRLSIIDGVLSADEQSTSITIASQVEAETGLDNTKVMTALRVLQSIAYQLANYSISALNTTSKYIVGAINELKSSKADKIIQTITDGNTVITFDEDKIIEINQTADLSFTLASSGNNNGAGVILKITPNGLNAIVFSSSFKIQNGTLSYKDINYCFLTYIDDIIFTNIITNPDPSIDIAGIPNVSFWLDTADVTKIKNNSDQNAAVGDSIKSMTDRIANKTFLYASGQATLQDGYINATGTGGYFIQGGDLSIGTVHSIFIREKGANSGDTGYYMNTPATNSGVGRNLRYAVTGASTQWTPTQGGTDRIISIYRNGNTLSAYENSTLLTKSVDAPPGSTAFSITSLFNTVYFNGRLYGIVIVNRIVNDTEKSIIVRYLQGLGL